MANYGKGMWWERLAALQDLLWECIRKSSCFVRPGGVNKRRPKRMIFYTFVTPLWHLFDTFLTVSPRFVQSSNLNMLCLDVFSRSRWSLSLAGLVPSLGTCWVSTLCSSVVSPMTRQKKRCNSMKIYDNYEPIAVSLHMVHHAASAQMHAWFSKYCIIRYTAEGTRTRWECIDIYATCGGILGLATSHVVRLQKIAEDCRRLQKIAEDCRRLQKTRVETNSLNQVQLMEPKAYGWNLAKQVLEAYWRY